MKEHLKQIPPEEAQRPPLLRRLADANFQFLERMGEKILILYTGEKPNKTTPDLNNEDVTANERVSPNNQE